MEAFSVATVVVLLAEIGDKTQLLALMLAVRYRRPWLISQAILLATLLNHALAAWVGNWVSELFSPDVLRYLLALSFFGVAVWTLVPDRMDDDSSKLTRFGPFVASLVLFFLAEIGDKTQIATVVLAAQYEPLEAVILGTTLGMLLANVPVVFLGNKLANKLPLVWIRRCAAALFAGLGIAALMGAGG